MNTPDIKPAWEEDQRLALRAVGISYLSNYNSNVKNNTDAETDLAKAETGKVLLHPTFEDGKCKCLTASIKMPTGEVKHFNFDVQSGSSDKAYSLRTEDGVTLPGITDDERIRLARFAAIPQPPLSEYIEKKIFDAKLEMVHKNNQEDKVDFEADPNSKGKDLDVSIKLRQGAIGHMRFSFENGTIKEGDSPLQSVSSRMGEFERNANKQLDRLDAYTKKMEQFGKKMKSSESGRPAYHALMTHHNEIRKQILDGTITNDADFAKAISGGPLKQLDQRGKEQARSKKFMTRFKDTFKSETTKTKERILEQVEQEKADKKAQTSSAPKEEGEMPSRHRSRSC